MACCWTESRHNVGSGGKPSIGNYNFPPIYPPSSGPCHSPQEVPIWSLPCPYFLPTRSLPTRSPLCLQVHLERGTIRHRPGFVFDPRNPPLAPLVRSLVLTYIAMWAPFILAARSLFSACSQLHLERGTPSPTLDLALFSTLTLQPNDHDLNKGEGIDEGNDDDVHLSMWLS